MSDHATARPPIAALLEAVERASGADAALDAAIHQALGPAALPGPAARQGPAAGSGDPDRDSDPDDPPPQVTGSVDDCLDLMARVLPDWHWHIGHGPDGILPYAALSRGEARFESGAPTVPLALLRVMLRALLSGGPAGPAASRPGMGSRAGRGRQG